MRSDVSRGEVWLIDFSPTRGHEVAGMRPGLVVSVDAFSKGPAELVVVVPMTSRFRGVPLHVMVDPPEAGLRQRSYVECEEICSVSTERLVAQWGSASVRTMGMVEQRLRMLMGL